MIVTNKMLLPIMLSYLSLEATALARAGTSEAWTDRLWRLLSRCVDRGPALCVLAVAAVLLVAGAWKAQELRIGDLGMGMPELRHDSRYNRDIAAITGKFAIGVNILSVIAQTRDVQGACTDYDLMDNIDRFDFYMRQVDGVQSVLSLPGLAKIINAGYNEGNLKWRALSRNPQVLAQSVTPIDTASGLLDSECSAMQVLLFTRPTSEAETIARIVREVKNYAARHDGDHIRFMLASGNVGVMAATNEAVDESREDDAVLDLCCASPCFAGSRFVRSRRRCASSSRSRWYRSCARP